MLSKSSKDSGRHSRLFSRRDRERWPILCLSGFKLNEHSIALQSIFSVFSLVLLDRGSELTVATRSGIRSYPT